jgi:predicted PurR-regulated permease PerM
VAILSKPLRAAEQEFRGTAGAVIAAGVIIYLLYWARAFFITSIVAVILAFILEPFVGLLMRLRLPRALASFVVCSLALLAVYLLGIGAYTQMSGLIDDLPKYSQRVTDIVDDVRTRLESTERSILQAVIPSRERKEQERLQQLQAQQQAEQSRRKKRGAEPPVVLSIPGAIPEVRIHEDRAPFVQYIVSRLGSFYQIVLMSSFVPFLVYFMLSWRDHMNRSFLQFFHGEQRLVASRILQGIAEMARAFVVGNFMLGLLLTVLSTAAFWMVKLPYSLLVGPLSAFLSLVPYVGLPLAIVPPLFVALTAFKSLSGYLIVAALVAAFHLIAMNLLYPKLVGSRVHLNPLVVTFSLMLWGFLWDAAGLLLAIPLTAGIKAVCDNVKELRPFGKFLGD